MVWTNCHRTGLLVVFHSATFGVESVLAAFSNKAEMLIVTHVLHGLAGATIAPSTLSLIHNMFDDPTDRVKAIGVWIRTVSVGAVMWPLEGGVLPEHKDETAGSLDISSAALSLAAVLFVIYALKHTAEDGLILLCSKNQDL